MLKNQSFNLDFPGVSGSVNAQVIQLQSKQPLHILSSAVVGGGLTQARVIINRHVDKTYNHPDPPQDYQRRQEPLCFPRQFKERARSRAEQGRKGYNQAGRPEGREDSRPTPHAGKLASRHRGKPSGYREDVRPPQPGNDHHLQQIEPGSG